MEHSNKDRAEFVRLIEIETYFTQQKSVDITIIALAVIIGLYLERIASCLIIGLSLFKLIVLIFYSIIEKHLCDRSSSLVATRSQQFWLYRFILLLQMFLLVWVLTEVMSHGASSSPTE